MGVEDTATGTRNADGYDRSVNRSIVVTAAAITTALRDVYGMSHLVRELDVN